MTTMESAQGLFDDPMTLFILLGGVGVLVYSLYPILATARRNRTWDRVTATVLEVWQGVESSGDSEKTYWVARYRYHVATGQEHEDESRLDASTVAEPGRDLAVLVHPEKPHESRPAEKTWTRARRQQVGGAVVFLLWGLAILYWSALAPGKFR